MIDTVPLERVERRARALRALEERVLEARESRDDAIRQARDAGHTLREIGETADLHHTAIAKIVREKEDPR